MTAACKDIDSVEVMREVFLLHAQGRTILPNEAYLSWNNDWDEAVRSLNMPGYIGGSLHTMGTKIINANIHNPTRGVPRASGLTLLYDNTSAQVLCIMEGAYISSLRTASVTTLAVELLKGLELHCAAIIGAGVLARIHIELLVKRFPQLRLLQIFDTTPQRIDTLQYELASLLDEYKVVLKRASTAEEAIRSAQLIIPVTTTTLGYIQYSWLQPGALLVNVSLDDPLPEVVLQADCIIVDDWNLVKNDPRSLLGRMYRQKQISGPDDPIELTSSCCKCINAQLGDLVIGSYKGRYHDSDIILVNPFGLAIEDVALAAYVYQKSLARDAGVWLPR